MQYIKMILVTSFMVLFTACGGGGGGGGGSAGGGGSVDTQKVAIEKIMKYATSGSPVPTVKDYADAGVKGVTASNLKVINRAVRAVGSSDVDTLEEIQAIFKKLDLTAPVITLLGYNPIAVVLHNPYNDANATARDNVDGDITASIVAVNSVNKDTIGSYTVTYNVEDRAGNSATEVVRTVNVIANDIDKPVITLLGDAAVTLERGAAYSDAGATASDNVDGNMTSAIKTENPVESTKAGTYTVTYNITDSSGNKATEVTRTVKVVDTVTPVVKEAKAVPATTKDNTPDYTFSSSEAGSITYGGACISSGTPAQKTAVEGNNTITFTPLKNGTYSDCTIVVTDPSGHKSDTLKVKAFKVDASKPAVTIDTPPVATGLNQLNYPVSGSCTTGDGNVTVAVSGATPAKQSVVCSSKIWNASFDVTAVADGTEKVIVSASQTDEAGNTGNAETKKANKDATAPLLSEVTAVATPTNDTTPDYTFSASEAGSITYSGACSSSVTTAVNGNNTITFNTLAEGTHSNCTVTVTDASGNPSTPLSVAVFEVDTTVPALSEVTAVATPANDITPDYTFSASEAGSITYSGDCSSADTTAVNGNNTITFNTLTEGTYSNCTVTLTDASGNPSTALSVAVFEVDTTAPALSEVTAVATPTNDATPDYTFSASEAGSITYSGDCSSADTTAVEGNNTITFTAVGDGTHSNCRVTVTDASGNPSTALVVTTFTVDSTAPRVLEVTAVATPTNDTTPDYTFSSDENGSITYGGDCSSATTDAVEGNNTITFNTLADGTYSNCTITVTDTLGNASNALGVRIFTVDTTAPTLTEVTAVATPGNDSTPDYTFSSDENGSITYGGSCSASVTEAAEGNNTITFNTLADGTYSDCTVTVTDATGNGSNTLSVTPFTIDTAAPSVAEVTVVATPTNDTTPDYTFSSNENGSITYGGDCNSTTTDATEGNNTITFNTLPEGTYSNCTVTVTDEANNTSTTVNVTLFTIDTTAPVLSEVTAVATPTNDTAPDYTFSASEAGSISYGGACSSATTDAVSGDNTITFIALADGNHSDCNITVTDEANNTGELNVTAFVVDTTPPNVSEITPVETPTIDTTPEYTFRSDEDGSVTYGGSCFGSAPTPATASVVADEDNTITFSTLDENTTYDDCSITVTDEVGNIGELNITAFRVVTPLSIESKPLAAGDRHSAEIRVDYSSSETNGTLWTSGWNSQGQLGNENTNDSDDPVQVGTSKDWVCVTTGGDSAFFEPHSDDDVQGFTLAINSSGALYSWGDNTYGQLGQGDTDNRDTPVQVGSDSDWVSVDAGDRHVVAIKSNGTLWTWGYNEHGETGHGTDGGQYTQPYRITTVGDGWISVSAGGGNDTVSTYDHQSGQTFAIKRVGIDGNRTLWAWGDNDYGQLGLGYANLEDNHTAPAQVGTENDWYKVSSGDTHTIALRGEESNRTLWTWGWNAYGQLGHGDTTTRDTPTQIGSGTTWSMISAGSYHNLAVSGDGLSTWGRNIFGGLGRLASLSYDADQLYPAPVGTEKDWLSISAGGYHSLGRRDDGSNILWVWGDNWYGQLGNGMLTDPKVTPMRDRGEYDWGSVSAGGKHTAAIRHNSGDGNTSLWIWGNNSNGQLSVGGTGLVTTEPHRESTESNWTSVASGFEYIVALRSDGTLWAWGDNEYGQIGDGTTVDKHDPVQIGTDTNWTSVASGGWHTAATQGDGNDRILLVWGRNHEGQLGDTTRDNNATPAKVDAGTGYHWESVSVADNHTVAIKVQNTDDTNRTLWAWGDNTYGQLGLGDHDDRNVSTQVGTESDWVSVDVSDYHTVAIKNTNELWVWGRNNEGQLGQNNRTNSTTPVQVDGAWASVSTGDYHTLAINTDGELLAWGDNARGQLGDGTLTDRTSPVKVGSDTDWESVSGGDWFSSAIKSVSHELWIWGANDYGQTHEWITEPELQSVP